MKTQSNNQRGFTVIEMLVVVAIIALLACILIPGLARAKAGANRIRCTSYLKQVGLSSRLWANDHEDRYPFSSTNAAGSPAWVNSPEVFRHYQVMSNELVTPRILACPADPARLAVTNFGKFSNTNLSYFVGLDAREDAPNSILSGDRNITGGTLSNGFLRVLRPGTAVEWTKEIHQNTGNIGLGDGSVQQVTTVRLRQQIALQTNAFIRLAVP
jgi:prepilin-type N-terminal cleavage/methylation domain-containing protein